MDDIPIARDVIKKWLNRVALTQFFEIVSRNNEYIRGETHVEISQTIFGAAICSTLKIPGLFSVVAGRFGLRITRMLNKTRAFKIMEHFCPEREALRLPMHVSYSKLVTS